jgi:hypothetical protein
MLARQRKLTGFFLGCFASCITGLRPSARRRLKGLRAPAGPPWCRRIGFEVKSSSTPKVSKCFRQAKPKTDLHRAAHRQISCKLKI